MRSYRGTLRREGSVSPPGPVARPDWRIILRSKYRPKIGYAVGSHFPLPGEGFILRTIGSAFQPCSARSVTYAWRPPGRGTSISRSSVGALS